MTQIRIVCAECGSDDVRRDAFAEWSVENQEWELAAVLDQGYCETCGGEADLEEEEIPDDPLTTQHAQRVEARRLANSPW